MSRIDDAARIEGEYLRLAGEVDAATDRIRRRHPAEVHCCPGCNLCCHDFFQISVLEAALVRRAVLELPAEVQAEIGRRVEALDRTLEAHGVALPERHYPEDDPEGCGRTFSARQRLRDEECLCPLNLDGKCSIYASRPILCRTFGYPVDGFFFGCPGGNFEDEDATYASLRGDPIDRRLEALRSEYVAGTRLEGRVTDNRYMGAVDWTELL